MSASVFRYSGQITGRVDINNTIFCRHLPAESLQKQLNDLHMFDVDSLMNL